MDPLLRLLKTDSVGIDAELRRLGVSRADFIVAPGVSLRDLIVELNGRIEGSRIGGTGMISLEKLMAIRHYLTEFALIYRL